MLVQDKPEGLPDTPNDLDNIEDPDEELNEHGLSIDRYLAFGTTPKALPHPPKDGEIVTYQVKVECVGQAHKRRSDGEMRYRSELSILSVARVGEDLPPDFTPEPTAAQKRAEEKAKVAAEQAERDELERAEAESSAPPMFDEEGNPVSIDAPRPPDADASDADPASPAAAADDYGRPGFSDGTQ